MTVYPISCVECRRRKIKCNKLGPVCNQCIKRGISCEFPGKFRSIEVESLIENNPKLASRPLFERKASSKSAKSSSPEVKSEEQLHSEEEQEVDPEELMDSLQRENEVLKLKLKELKLRLRQNSHSDNGKTNGKDYPSDHEEAVPGRYYGPNSTEYMINQTGKAKPDDYDNFMKVRRQISQKRDLPILLDVPPESLNKIKVRRQLATSDENIELIVKLVKRFFMFKTHYINFIEEKPLLEFLNGYTRMKEWSHDDEMLLVLAILITTLRSLEPDNELLTKNNLSYVKLRGTLYKQFKNLKNGIAIDTVTSLQSYVLECEDLFYNDQTEKSWILLFRIVSSAYSLGLHVFDKGIVHTLNNEGGGEKSLDIIRNHPRTSLWLTINFMSAVLCSILGRPNPVTFTFQPLLRNCEIRLNYKIGIAELIKKSTTVLIESYKVEIDYDTISDIDEEFENEVIIYEKILSDRRAMRQEPGSNGYKASMIRIPLRLTDRRTKKRKTASMTALNELPSDFTFTIQRPYEGKMERCSLLETDAETLCDLILIYGNRAKFHQHFMAQHATSAKTCLESVIKVLDHCFAVIEILKDKMDTTDFQSIYSFFYCFAYQSFVVIYTFLMQGLPFVGDYLDEIKLIRGKLRTLFETVGEELWRPSAVRIVQYINEMCDNLFKENDPSRVPSNSNFNKSNSGLLRTPSLRNLSFLKRTDSTLFKSPVFNEASFFIDDNVPRAKFSLGSECGEDDQFVDPVLGFDLDDPFFVQNPINFNVARPAPPVRTDTNEYAKYFDGDGNIHEFGGDAEYAYLAEQ